MPSVLATQTPHTPPVAYDLTPHSDTRKVDVHALTHPIPAPNILPRNTHTSSIDHQKVTRHLFLGRPPTALPSHRMPIVIPPVIRTLIPNVLVRLPCLLIIPRHILPLPTQPPTLATIKRVMHQRTSPRIALDARCLAFLRLMLCQAYL